MFYTTISLIKYLCTGYVFICGGHHDSDRIAVLVMVSKAESIVLYTSIILYYVYLPKYRFPFFPHSFAPGIDAKYIKDKADCIVHADSTYQKKKKKKIQGGPLIRAIFFAQNYLSGLSAN